MVGLTCIKCEKKLEKGQKFLIGGDDYNPDESVENQFEFNGYALHHSCAFPEEEKD
jgi:hypothetical protein